MSLGGFQSGFRAQAVTRAQAKWPQYLICRCTPPCDTLIQLVSHVSQDVEFELCASEAEKMGRVLIGAARGGGSGEDASGTTTYRQVDWEHGPWECTAPGCGMAWTFVEGGPQENGMRFCPGCGRRVTAVEPWEWEDGEEEDG